MASSINITKSAWNRIKIILNKTNKDSFLFSASGGGCNGYNYIFKVIEEEKFETIFNESKIRPTIIENNCHKVLVDPISEMLLIGTTIDFEETIYESKFKFYPNKEISRTCGCGSSFLPREPKIPEKFIW